MFFFNKYLIEVNLFFFRISKLYFQEELDGFK